MVRIYTLTLAPSLDSATITPQIYPEGKLRCTAPVFEPGGGGINVARAIAHLAGARRLYSRPAARPVNISSLCWPMKMSLLPLSKRRTGPARICMYMWNPAVSSIALSCPAQL